MGNEIEWSVSFFENGRRLDDFSDEFAELVKHNSYQYFDFSYGDRRLLIHKRDQYANPTHNERWDFSLSHYEHEFANSTVLDVGANMGFWSLRSIKAGATRAIMIEIESGYFRLAEVIFNFFGLRDKVTFMQMNIKDLATEKIPGDICLIMRIFHFFPKEEIESILKNIVSFTRKFVVINPVESYLYSMLPYMNVSYSIHTEMGKYLSTAIIRGKTDDIHSN